MSTNHNRRALAPLVGVLAVGCLAAAACGGSSSSNKPKAASVSSSTTAVSSAMSTTRTGRGSLGGSSSKHGSPSSNGGTAATTQPSSTRSASGNAASSHKASGGSHPAYSATLKAAITKFVGCMDGQGIRLPAPNFNGKPSEILSSKGINTKSPAFEHAMNACGADLLTILRAGGASVPSP